VAAPPPRRSRADLSRWERLPAPAAKRVGQDHIVVARGRDYGDTAPVKGVLRTAGTQTTGHKVDVIPR